MTKHFININISVILPTYNNANYVRCAIASLLRQTYEDWELIIVDDGSTDNLQESISDYLSDERIFCISNNKNEGLGFSLNRAIDVARGTFIAYLPADDIYFKDHLLSMYNKIVAENADLVYSGIVHNIGNHGGERGTQQCLGQIDGQTLQLVQVMHRKTANRWIERAEFVTDDLNEMFWADFQKDNPHVVATKEITCEWFSHMYQRHNIMNDRTGGGIYMYRTYYGVKTPLRYHSSAGNLVDEIEHYSHLQAITQKTCNKKSLKILFVGELAFNPERILAFEEEGHKLYGLWINNPLCYNTVGPLPFGHVEDIPFEGWEKRVKEIKPDVIYATLNFKAVELAHHVLMRRPKDIPFIWHFKEGPFFCRTYGLWNKLIDLFELADGIIYTNRRMQQWFDLFLRKRTQHTIMVDGDLPSKQWFKDERQSLLSDNDGEIHTVLAGRMFGLNSEDIETLGKQHIHLHIYGDVNYKASQKVIDEASALVPGYVHLHPNCPTENWVKEFSQYDAGWLHYYESTNHGDLMRASWTDINSPARMSTYAMAGLPMIMHDNSGHIVHHQEYLENLDMAITTPSFTGLGEKFSNKSINVKRRENAWKKRMMFCFDTYIQDIMGLIEEITD